MSLLKRLQITSLRNLGNVSVTLSPTINIFYGQNGSGKTSLLEAITLLGLGRSFRSHKIRTVIEHNKSDLTIFAELLKNNNDKGTIGIQRARSGKNIIRINGDNVQSAVSLAQELPLQIINADAFLLLEGSSSQRKRFLDWMVFHVKPEFSSVWKRLQRVIKQRNSALKHDKICYSDIALWDEEFVGTSNIINKLRKDVLKDFKNSFYSSDNKLSDLGFDIDISYKAGWDEEIDFAELLKSSFEKDIRSGFTNYGPHRADLKFKVGTQLASDVLSRGQEKSLICSLHIAQAYLFSKVTGQQCVFLIDDLLAELDADNAKKLTRALIKLKSQVFVTGIYKENLLSVWLNNSNSERIEGVCVSVFHVEHGDIQQKNTVSLV